LGLKPLVLAISGFFGEPDPSPHLLPALRIKRLRHSLKKALEHSSKLLEGVAAHPSRLSVGQGRKLYALQENRNRKRVFDCKFGLARPFAEVYPAIA
jgi:hypothetical protein